MLLYLRRAHGILAKLKIAMLVAVIQLICYTRERAMWSSAIRHPPFDLWSASSFRGVVNGIHK